MENKNNLMDPETGLNNESSGSFAVKENIMGTESCNKLLLSMSLPIMASMLVQALYNIVDSVFVSRINENALTAVSLALPIQNLMIAVICGTGVGINARLSRKLGEKNSEAVNKTAGNAISLAILIMLVFMGVGFLFSGTFMRAMTNDAQIIEYGIDYIQVVTIFCGGLAFQIVFERLVQSTGKTIYSMISQGAGAVINIILDPIFIFGLCGVPAMGVKGAAIATVIGQWIGALIGLYCNFRYNHEISLKPRYFKLEAAIVKDIFAVGFPSIIMQSIGSFLTFGLNKILLTFSSTAAAVFGVYFKLQSFVFMPIFGLNNGLVPIIAYNYGAKKPDRIKKTFRYAVMYSLMIMTAGFLVFLFKPELLLMIFDASEEMIRIGSVALPVISMSFVFAGYAIVCSSMFQALSHGVLSLGISVIRQLVILLPAAYIFSKLGGLNALWWAFPFAEAVSFVISFIQVKRIIRHQVDSLR
ncbi:MAG: MATE family efflux transporter [Eubacteriales bacterium]|nr:MATE family efflux transporter [Eubacteriales bacterium]